MTAQAAPTRRERDAILRSGRRMLLISIAFAIGIFALASTLGGRPVYLIAWGAGFVTFAAYIAIECTRLVRELGRIRADASPDDAPNDTALRAGWTAMANRVGDRVFRSEATFLGLPLIDINLSAPMPPGAKQSPGPVRPGGRAPRRPRLDRDRGRRRPAGRLEARGFIAIGGRASAS